MQLKVEREGIEGGDRTTEHSESDRKNRMTLLSWVDTKNRLNDE